MHCSSQRPAASLNVSTGRKNMEMMCHSNNHGTGPSDVHAPLRGCTGKTWAPTTMYLNRATLIYMVPSTATSPTALAQQWQLQLINRPLAGWQLPTPTPPPSWTFGHAIWRAPKQQQLLCYYPAVIYSIIVAMITIITAICTPAPLRGGADPTSHPWVYCRPW